MATALDVIKRAMRMIGELAAETGEAPSAAAAEQALATLNSMLAGWENKGIRLGIDTLALTTTVPVPPSHDDAIAFGLAVNMAAEFGQDPPPAVAGRAAEEFAALQAAYTHAPQTVVGPEYAAISRRWW